MSYTNHFCASEVTTTSVPNARGATFVAEPPYLVAEVAITVEWRGGDLDSFPPLSAPLPVAQRATSMPTTNGGSATMTGVSEDSQSTAIQDASLREAKGISAGAKAAIGVVVPLSVLIAIGIALWIIHKRRRAGYESAKRSEATGSPERSAMAQLDSIPMLEAEGRARHAEADSAARVELECNSRVPEIGNAQSP